MDRIYRPPGTCSSHQNPRVTSNKIDIFGDMKFCDSVNCWTSYRCPNDFFWFIFNSILTRSVSYRFRLSGEILWQASYFFRSFTLEISKKKMWTTTCKIYCTICTHVELALYTNYGEQARRLGPHHHGQTALAANDHSAPLSLSLSVLMSYSCIGTILHTILCPALALFADGRTGHRFFFSLLHCVRCPGWHSLH